jgi:hypothetical protein
VFRFWRALSVRPIFRQRYSKCLVPQSKTLKKGEKREILQPFLKKVWKNDGGFGEKPYLCN